MRRGWIVALGMVAVAAACSNGTEPKVTSANPLADSAGVDARRKQMGLPSLAEYLRLADSVMRAP